MEVPHGSMGTENNGKIGDAESEALERVELALSNLRDDVSNIIIQYTQGRDSLEFSSQIFHCYPTNDHKGFELRQASNDVMQKVYTLSDESTRAKVLRMLVDGNPLGKGVMFQNYVQRILRLGGRSFKAKSIDDGTEITIEVGEGPKTKFFHT
ncbi:hypothetical protein BCR41DRAFT_19606 [Lobosporangium transversale]|uniref:Uncharacterized protein n=1 Tax=Lobosporangium transversale TaxID=64571 RepID=A0A1Y2GTX9_9FUNG|nr:hypothetical protein BCR41DRAFT_19606 [Lobosporangium transversale]ORZ21716.1 hypothetical protein BCR41DRAFT_19606 [Lobosporangium transversale]|eukprot:XP_021882967.1 hypothetical protein BCR41DRAFT_19606 [Lobosporangium transversale]